MFPDDLVRKLLDEVDRSVQALEEEHRHHLEGQSVDLDIVNAGLALLDQMGSLWGKSDVAIRKRLQRFVFPDGTSFDGSRFGATVLPACLQLGEEATSSDGSLVHLNIPDWNPVLRELTELAAIATSWDENTAIGSGAHT